jgi:protein tyrosine phosphatase domain-containing protein 1
MVARIGFVNLSWRDMGVPTLDKMMDIVQARDLMMRCGLT